MRGSNSPEDQAGYWSYVGTEILEIDKDKPTMNLEGFTMRTSEAEFKRVVRHEAGHTLGFDHEHMRSDIVKLIDRDKAISFFDEDQGWTSEEVEEQVLTPLAKKSIMGTKEADPISIMCYQLPAAIMKNGKPIKGGKDINPRDHRFACVALPKKEQDRHTAAIRPRGHLAATAGIGGARVPRAARRHGTAGARDRSPVPAPHSGLGNVFELVIMDEFRPNRDAPRRGETPEFAQVLASYGGARVTSVMRLRAGDGEKNLSSGRSSARTSASRNTPTGKKARFPGTRT